jgi:hypothetical protein
MGVCGVEWFVEWLAGCNWIGPARCLSVSGGGICRSRAQARFSMAGLGVSGCMP